MLGMNVRRGREAGLIDLLSIIVGVILIGIAAAGVVATLFQIVPWAQDNTARQSLSAVRTAESTAFAMDHRYSSFTGLVAAKRIPASNTLAAGLDADGTCFVGISKSATGKIFFITDTSTGATELTRSTDPGCVDAATLAGLVDSVGGFPGTAAPPQALQGIVTTLAGSSTYGYADGTGSAARFNAPAGVAVDSSGTVYVADYGDQRIRKISSAGVVTTLAGSGMYGFADGTGAAAQFKNPEGVAVDSSGTVYVADLGNQRIRKITPAGVVTTLAGSGVAGFADGTGVAAQFYAPASVAVDSSGTVYVGDTYNNRIRKITPAGVVTTLAGSGIQGFADGTGSVAQFAHPRGVVVDSAGTVYVADTSNHRIRKISSAGVVTTLAGAGTSGFADGTEAAAQFNLPFGVAVDPSGTVYVADRNNNRIRTISSAGVVTTLAGSGVAAFADGTGSAARFYYPFGVAVDSSGTVYVGDSSNYRVRKIQ